MTSFRLHVWDQNIINPLITGSVSEASFSRNCAMWYDSSAWKSDKQVTLWLPGAEAYPFSPETFVLD